MLQYLSNEEQNIYHAVRDYIDSHTTPELINEAETGEYIFGGPESRKFIKGFAENGWLVPHWPKEYGGLEASQTLNFAIRNTLSYHGLPTFFVGAHMAGDMVLHHGTDYLKVLLLQRIARGEIELAVGYSEPGAGSDLLSLTMKAEDRGDHYVVNGQKVFNTHAHVAQYHWLAVRTDSQAPNHKALSILVVDLDSPGITISPMISMAGTQTNEVFYDNVKVPKDRLVGKENEGVKYIMGQLALERMFPYGQHQHHFEKIIEKLVQTEPDNGIPLHATAIGQQAAQLKIELEASRLLYERCPVMMDKGIVPEYQSSMEKLFVTEFAQRLSKFDRIPRPRRAFNSSPSQNI